MPDHDLNVLIESDWNLKIVPTACIKALTSVLIESDWNLKMNAKVQSA